MRELISLIKEAIAHLLLFFVSNHIHKVKSEVRRLVLTKNNLFFLDERYGKELPASHNTVKTEPRIDSLAHSNDSHPPLPQSLSINLQEDRWWHHVAQTQQHQSECSHSLVEKLLFSSVLLCVIPGLSCQWFCLFGLSHSHGLHFVVLYKVVSLKCISRMVSIFRL